MTEILESMLTLVYHVGVQSTHRTYPPLHTTITTCVIIMAYPTPPSPSHAIVVSSMLYVRPACYFGWTSTSGMDKAITRIVPHPLIVWQGTCTVPQSDEDPTTLNIQTHAGAAIYTASWADMGFDNAGVQIPIKLTDRNDYESFCCANNRSAARYYLNFVNNKQVDLYKATATGFKR